MKYEALCGTHVNDVAHAMVLLANEQNESVESYFNEIPLTAAPGETADDVIRRFNEECNRRRAAYEASPAGREAARRAAEARQRAAAAESEGIKPFSLKDPAGWKECVAANSDPYGACTARYAARWANLMEAKIAGGAKLEDIADPASHEADLEGITGFMYGCAVGILSKVWEHGEELRRWHNLKTQIRNEGEKANDSGGVLNPALLTIG